MELLTKPMEVGKVSGALGTAVEPIIIGTFKFNFAMIPCQSKIMKVAYYKILHHDQWCIFYLTLRLNLTQNPFYISVVDKLRAQVSFLWWEILVGSQF